MITITGSNSFIGKNLINFLNRKNVKNSSITRKKIKSNLNKKNYYSFTPVQKKKNKSINSYIFIFTGFTVQKKKFFQKRCDVCFGK